MADDACIVDKNIDASEFIDGLLNDRFCTVFFNYAGIVRDSYATSLPNLFDYRIRFAVRCSVSVMGCAQVVDDYACSLSGKADRMRTSQSVACSRNNGHSSPQHVSHYVLPK